MPDDLEPEVIKVANINANRFVCAVTASTSTITALRSYKPRRNPDFFSERCTIWEACRATSAATGLFEPITIGSCGQTFIDGAITYNNPVQLVYDEARDIFGQDRTDNAILVSIGTGRGSLKSFKGNLKKIVEAMKKLVTDSQKAHEDFSNSHRDMVNRSLFFRFNVYPGLENVEVHEYAQAEKIEAATQDYLHNSETQGPFNNCIRMLLLEYKGSQTQLASGVSSLRVKPDSQQLPTTNAISVVPPSSNERRASPFKEEHIDSSRFCM